MYKFKRPEHLSFPHVYYTFTAKDKSNERDIDYRVQDLPVEYYDEAVAFMVKYFVPDETFCASRDVPNQPGTLAEFRKFWRDMLMEKLSIACFRNDGCDELVGANFLLVKSKDDPEDDEKVGREVIFAILILIRMLSLKTRPRGTFSVLWTTSLSSSMCSRTTTWISI